MEKKSVQERFSDRVENYIKYRPSYPKAALNWIFAEGQLTEESTVADIGSGTGIFTRLLLDRVKKVFAVEPNAPMREAAEKACMGHSGFFSVNGSSENTGLPNQCADLISAAQAFHWFKLPQALFEFKRILKSGGLTALVWNERQLDTEFLKRYDDALRKWSLDYLEVNHKNITDTDLESYFLAGMKKQIFENAQKLNWQELIGRMQSSSYCPKPAEPSFTPLLNDIRKAFDEYQENGSISFTYKTIVYLGKL